MPSETLSELVAMSNRLGRPENDYVILGEGNTSAAEGDGTFWVKVSGAALRTAGPEQFVRVDMQRVLAVLDAPPVAEKVVHRMLRDARVGPAATAEPSIETIMHALFLSCDGVEFVGHTHPTAINILTCSKSFESAVGQRLFAEDRVIGSFPPLAVPYKAPGSALAREIHTRLKAYLEVHAGPPSAVYLGNHGFVALGETPDEVEAVTAVAVRAARVLVGTYALGGPNIPVAWPTRSWFPRR